jgi:hypothetical protein
MTTTDMIAIATNTMPRKTRIFCSPICRLIMNAPIHSLPGSSQKYTAWPAAGSLALVASKEFLRFGYICGYEVAAIFVPDSIFGALQPRRAIANSHFVFFPGRKRISIAERGQFQSTDRVSSERKNFPCGT